MVTPLLALVAVAATMPMQLALDALRERKSEVEESCVYEPRGDGVEMLGSGARDCDDVWGYTSPVTQHRFAVSHCRADAGEQYHVVVFNVTSTVELLTTVAFAPTSRWSDYKTYGHHLYGVTEQHLDPPLLILDLERIDEGIVTTFTPTQFETETVRTTHNVAIHEERGVLYRCGEVVGMVAYDLTENPLEPRYLGKGPPPQCHDLQVVTHPSGRDIAYVATWDAVTTPPFAVVDVTDPTNMVLLSEATYPNPRVAHQVWVDAEQHYAYFNDEEYADELVSAIIIFDISDLHNARYVKRISNGELSNTHNLMIRNHILFQANYLSGLRVYDITQRLEPVEVAHYDTHTRRDLAWEGMWGVYPFDEAHAVTSGLCGVYSFRLHTSACVMEDGTRYRSLSPPYETPMTMQDLFIVFYHILGRSTNARVDACADSDDSGGVQMNDLFNLFYVLLGRQSPAVHG